MKKRGDRVAPRWLPARNRTGTIVKDEVDGEVIVYWDESGVIKRTKSKYLVRI